MGQYADDLIDNGWYDHDDCFENEINNDESPSVKKARARIESVRKELKVLLEKKKAEGDPNFLNNARKEINLKYGKGWRGRGLVANDSDQWSG